MTAAHVACAGIGIETGAPVQQALVVEHQHFTGLQFDGNHALAPVHEFEQLAQRIVKRLDLLERGIDRRAMYLSCYWKQGDTDEGMKRAKRIDAERDKAALSAAG